MAKRLLTGITSVTSLTVAQAFRIATSVGASLVVVWGLSGPFVKSYAQDAFSEMLTENEAFQKLQQQSDTMVKDMKDLTTDTDKIQRQLNDTAAQIENINRSTEKVEDLVNKLLTIQLQRADMSFSPPGSGPAGLPEFGSAQ